MPRALIVTAIDPEFIAARAHMQITGTDVDHRGTVYTLGTFQGQHHNWDIGLIPVDQGNTRSGILTALGVTHFQPDLVLFVGVAGCLKPEDLGLGDVVAGGMVRGYERGKETDQGFQLRSESYSGAHRLVQAAHQVVHADQWQNRAVNGRGRPKAIVGTIAAGEKLLTSERGPVHEFLTTNVTDAVAVEMEGLGVATAAHICGAEAIVLRAISDNLADKEETDKEEWQPVAASHAAAFAFEVLAVLRLPSTGAGAVPLGSGDNAVIAPSGLPPNLQERFNEIAAAEPTLAARLSEALRFPAAAGGAVLVDLITTPPDWLASASPVAWQLIGALSELYEAFAAASVAYERAARLRPPHWYRWLARAAASSEVGGDQARATALMGEAQASGHGDVFVATFAAASRQDWPTTAGLLDRADVNAEEAMILDAYVAFALWQLERYIDSTARLDAAAAAHPERAGPLLAHAELLLRRATHEKSLDRMGDLQTSVKLAIEARDRYHVWGGTAVRALLIACQAALAADDAQTVLRLALNKEIGGEATDLEAADPRILTLASRAAVLAGRDDVQSQLLPMMRGTFSAALMDALRMKRALGKDPRVVEALGIAAALAVDPSEIFATLFHLADVGADLPRYKLKLLADADSELADVVAARAASANGDFVEAIDRLRRWSPSSADASRALGHTHAEAGEIETAIEVFRTASDRFGVTTMLLDAVDVALVAKRPELAEEPAEMALLRLPDRHPGRAYALGRLVQIAADRQEWRLVEERARLLRREADSVSARWALTIALYNQAKLDEAWRVLSEEPPLEASERTRALLVVLLLSEAATPERAAPWLVELAEKFAEDEEVAGTALLAIAFLRVPRETIEPYQARIQEVVRAFGERFPTSTIFRVESVASPEDLLARAEVDLQQGSDEMFRLEAAVRDGDVPYGLLTATVRKPYAIAFTPPGAGFLVAIAKSVEQHEAARAAAHAALGHAVVADTSAVAVTSQLTDAWVELRAKFHRVHVTDVAVRDAILARKLAGGRAGVVILIDKQTKKAVPVPIRPEDSERHAVLTAHLAELMTQADQLQCDALPAFSELDSPERHLAWLSSIQVARDRQLPLWSDDAAHRSLASEMGVPAFGTDDLIQVLVAADRLAESLAARWRREMILARVGDFPLEADTLLAIASQSGWVPGPVSDAMRRPAAWADHRAAHAVFMRIFTDVYRDAPDLLPHWLAVAATGSIARVPASAHVLAGVLLATAIAMARFNPLAVPALVEATRQVSKETTSTDPLPPAVERFLETATELLGARQAATLTVRTFGELADPDRITVANIVFGKRS